jgi:tetratricopeptide (TPR) repeat protein/CHAT domain-containing protein
MTDLNTIQQQIEALNSEAVQLYYAGQLPEAIALFQEALQLTQAWLGPEHPETAARLYVLGTMLQWQGDLAGARLYHEQALGIHQKVLGPEDPGTAASLHVLGQILQAQGDLAGARLYLEQALAIHQKVLGPEDPDTALSLHTLGETLQAQGDVAGARTCYEKALAIRLKVLGPEHPDSALSLNNLGMLLQVQGDLAGARPYHEQALAICQKVLGPEHPNTATSLGNLGMLLRVQGDLAGARPYHEQALAICQKVLGSQHPNTAASLYNLAILLQAQGDLAGARPYYERALAIFQKVLGPEHPFTALKLNNLGNFLQAQGDLAGARPYFEQALAIRLKMLGPEHPDSALSLNNLGMLLRAQGDLTGARPYLERALAICQKVLGPEHPATALSLNNLGILLQAQRDLAGARPYFERALAICQKVLGPEHPATALSLNNLGVLLQMQGDLTEAQPYYEQALAICQKVLGPEHPDNALSLNNLACLWVALDQPTKALTLLQQAASIDDRMLGQVFSIASDRQRAAFLGTLQGKTDAFLSLISQYLWQSAEAVRAALELVLRRKTLAAEALAAQRDAVLGGKYPLLQASLRQLTELRSAIARKTLAGPGPEGVQEHHQQLTQSSSQKELLEAELARQIPEMNLERQLRQADRRALALTLPEGVSLVEFVRFRVFDFKAVPGRGERQWQPARYLAFVLPANEPENVQMIDLGEADPIDLLIADFRASITSLTENRDDRNLVKLPSASASGSADAGVRLRAAVFDRLTPALGGCRRLLLAPDGDLCRLPFEVLPGADGRLLIDTYQISYLSCGRDVLRFAAASTGQPSDPLVVGDPDFNLATETTTAPLTPALPKTGLRWGLFGGSLPASPRETEPAHPAQTGAGSPGRLSRDFNRGQCYFSPLPGTRVEGERLAALLGVQPLLAGAALEDALKACRSPRILHLATHGFFLPDQPPDLNQLGHNLGLIGAGETPGLGLLSGPGMESPMLRSGVALAGANTFLRGAVVPAEAEDGLLTAEDVAGLDLLDTELVVLSACETGLGAVHAGEGVFGLRRAFVVAGAKTLVMSLWKVPDLATAFLMDRFYDNLLTRGLARDLALREAQRTTRDATVAQLKGEWLTPTMIEQLAAGDADARRRLQDLAQQPDDYRPFEHPLYWGAFICQGDPAPLRTGPGGGALSRPGR